MLGVTILGNNSAVPAHNRHPTAQVVNLQNELFIVDCGEGTQIQLIQYKIRRSKISHIFISHLHGDHYFGLIGLITSFGLLGRTQDLTVYAPGNLKEIIELQLNAGAVILPYKLNFVQIKEACVLLHTTKIKVTCFPTNHRIVCYGFRFDEIKNLRSIAIEQCIANDIPASFYTNLQIGEDYVKKDGTVIKNDLVTTANTPSKSYAYCADTKYDENIIPYIENVQLMYHETTYLDNLILKAEERYHSTSKQAATIALKANVQNLIIGHFSSKYETLDAFEEEAKTIFLNTAIAKEGVSFYV
jgi:ribonuclease Z